VSLGTAVAIGFFVVLGAALAATYMGYRSGRPEMRERWSTITRVLLGVGIAGLIAYGLTRES
jgi:hypothetical protein